MAIRDLLVETKKLLRSDQGPLSRDERLQNRD